MRAQLIELTPDSATPVAEAVVVEHALHDRLAVVESALDREGVDVRRAGGGHLPALHLRDAAVREEDEDVDRVAPAEGLDRRPAGVARGRADDRRALAALGQHVVHEPREELHRHVLEGQRRAVEELQHQTVGPDLDERAHGRMAEGGIGLAHQAFELGLRDLAADERRQDAQRKLRIGKAPPGAQLVAAEMRPAFGT